MKNKTKLKTVGWEQIQIGDVYHWLGRRWRKIGLNEGTDLTTGATSHPLINARFKIRVPGS